MTNGGARQGLLHQTEVTADERLHGVSTRPGRAWPPILYAATVTKLARRGDPAAFVAFLAVRTVRPSCVRAGLEDSAMRHPELEVQTHPIVTRITHWLMALAILILIGSGWRIYNASPIFDFTFPEDLTLGGDVEQALALHNDPGVASAIAWHFAAMWLLALELPRLHAVEHRSPAISAATSCRSARYRSGATSTAAARFKLDHRLGEYNAVQRVAYWGVLAAVAMMLLSGIAIWKPVQTYPLETPVRRLPGRPDCPFPVHGGDRPVHRGPCRPGDPGAEDLRRDDPRQGHRRAACTEREAEPDGTGTQAPVRRRPVAGRADHADRLRHQRP